MGLIADYELVHLFVIVGYWQEGAEEEADNENNDDAVDALLAEAEEKEGEPKERARKTSKYMTKYERARILGTRALQIR